jgi:hypothetical protein
MVEVELKIQFDCKCDASDFLEAFSTFIATKVDTSTFETTDFFIREV